MIIINIGDELLIGQVVNTNASYMAERLNAFGFTADSMMIVGDKKEDIQNAIHESFQKTDLVIVTGGLGPTKDDITKNLLCEYFETKLVLDENSLAVIEKMLAERNVPMNESNRKQAEVPEGATVLKNRYGTAPGLWLEKEGKTLIALPGVPYELKGIMEEELLPLLKTKFHPNLSIIHKVVQTTGISESALSELLEPWELQLPPFIKLAYLPRPGITRLRLTAVGENQELLQSTLQSETKKLTDIAKEYIWSYEDNQLEEVVGKLLKKLRRNLTLAESCTGGYLAHLITTVPGSSAYFKGSIVSYSNEVKRQILNVREQNIKKQGAVSEPVVSDMAINTMDLFDADYSVAISGIAGPDGGTKEKPIGTVWIAVATTTRLTTKEFHFGSTVSRQNIIQRAAVAALNMLRMELIKDL